MNATTIGSANPSSYPTPATSVGRLFYDRVAATPTAEAFRHPVGDGWESVTWGQAAETVRTLAAGLLALGIGPQERVAIASSTRIDWLYADLAVMCAGGATTSIYPSTGVEDIGYILTDSGTRLVFAEDDTQIAKLRSLRDHIPDVILVEHPSAVDEAVAAVLPEHLATLMYTSGTTGRPKGVELPHRCWTYVGAGAEAIELLTIDDLQFLWLPLSHSFGKMLEAVQLQIGFPTAIDGRMDNIVENLATVRPTFMAGPPRIFEKVHSSVVQTMQEEGGTKLRLFTWAFDVGGRVSRDRLAGEQPGWALRAQHALADRLVLSKVRDRLGGRIRFMVSGSAALSADVATWFHAAGLLVLEGYGLTETSAATCLVRPIQPAFGVVGPPLTGTEVAIAPDGEILVRGPGVMSGYHNLPDATAEALSPDGWFASGDIGEIDPTGRLRITDRKKDLMKTSGGKYIAPQTIEVMFRAVCPLASQMLVHADRRNYATALITLDPDALAQWARAQGLTGRDYAALAADPAVRDYVQSSIEELNGRLNRWETIKDFRILDHDLSVEADELTPSMKVKRKVVEGKYQALLDSMYSA
jgi:long-chain acyl-CoA synthetase